MLCALSVVYCQRAFANRAPSIIQAAAEPWDTGTPVAAHTRTPRLSQFSANPFTPPFILQYKGLTCPLDGFELLLFSLAGQDGKTYPLCPLCFSYPPFEVRLVAGGCWHCAGAARGALPCAEPPWRWLLGVPALCG
jgi:hypothetical protein